MKHPLRTQATQDAYDNKPHQDDCFLCVPPEEKVIKEYTHFRIIENQYPYDLICSVHHILAPKRHVPHRYYFTEEERDEYFLILHQLEKSETYDAIIQNFMHRKSVPEHEHVHLVRYI